jgi:hypothetical protein
MRKTAVLLSVVMTTARAQAPRPGGKIRILIRLSAGLRA